MKLVAIALSLLLSIAVAHAQHKHSDKGPNGGPMQDVAGVHVELIKSSTVLTFNVYDEAGKPVATEGFSGSAQIVSGGDRETVTLTPAGGHVLTAQAKKAIPAAAQITVVIKTAAGKSGQVRF